jgi:hemin uptake protein HemP
MILVYDSVMFSQAIPSEPTPSAPAATGAMTDRLDVAGALARGRIHSCALLNQRRTLEIEHEGCIYQLRLTSNGKLILTK